MKNKESIVSQKMNAETEERKPKQKTVADPPAAYESAAREEPLYTLQDYLALPDDQRMELIDGVFYEISSPAPIHQAILGHIYVQLYPCAENHPECELFLAPSDVRLDNDDYTVVQPDIYIICGRDAEERLQRMVSGAPDFVIEILSPSNRSHDKIRKLNKYRSAGVREYWIVDPENLEVLVYDLEHGEPPKTYTFSDTIPVLISEGECAVDFFRIYERIRQYYAAGPDASAQDILKEAEPAYFPGKIQGEYTTDDYYALPDEQRVELIDGVIYDMAAPLVIHQAACGAIYRQIDLAVRARKGSYKTFYSPVDVRICCDNKTMVQPDILIVCDPKKIRRWGIEGAPDFILEALSPGTRRKDMVIKLAKYREAGVREYWMLDPDGGKLIICLFDEGSQDQIRDISGQVGIHICHGEITVDLDEIADVIREYKAAGD